MKKAYTLIEILLYAALVGTILTLISLTAIDMFHSYSKNLAYQTLHNQSRFILNRIVSEVQGADRINTSDSIFQQATGKLSLAMSLSAENPTIIELSGNAITIKKGSSNPVTLTGADVRATELRFTNLSAAQTPGTVKIRITMEYADTGGRSDLQSNVSLETTVNVRKTQ